jgi:hypothetical protein
VSELSVLFEHIPHPRTRDRVDGNAPPPPKVNDERVGFNGRIGLYITERVGTMWAAYIFTAIALLSLPAILAAFSAFGWIPNSFANPNVVGLVAWVAQAFLQLVLLPIIIVGQNLQSKAADKRAEQTYNDAEAVLHECVQIQAHLGAQDKAYNEQLAALQALITHLGGTPPAASPATN